MNNLHQYAHSQKFGKPYISKVILGASKTNGIVFGGQREVVLLHEKR
jgi:hydroxylamine reductase (hybrid-cluster protein)